MRMDCGSNRPENARIFAADCGRAALTLDEIKEWASVQQDDQLRLRLERLVSRGESSL